MELFQKMNMSIDHIEKGLTSKIDYAELAKMVNCSVYHYQRMFSFITGVPLAEYIRRRKLTCAAFELQNSSDQIIEIALKYGYESPESFTRAFKTLHGIVPKEARKKGVQLKAFPPLSFQISIKGDVEMKYRIEELDEFKVIGMAEKVETENPNIPKIWEKAFAENLFEKLWSIRKENTAFGGILGVMSDGDWGNNDFFNYTIGIESELNEFEKMKTIKISKSKWAVFEVEGHPENLIEAWKRMYSEWLPVSNYNLANIPAIECYLPKEDNKNELWIPVISKK